MKNFSTLLAVIAVSTTLQASYTHFGVPFTNKEHIKFAYHAGCRGDKYDYLENIFDYCEEGVKVGCKRAIKTLSFLIEKNEFSYEVFWRRQQMVKYKALLKSLEERKAQIEKLEELPDEERITPDDIRTIFEKVRPKFSPYDGYFDSNNAFEGFEGGWLAPDHPGYDPSDGEIHPYIGLGSSSEEILNCKVFKINKKRYGNCHYWSALLHEAQHTINDDQKLVDKLQRFSTMKEY